MRRIIMLIRVAMWLCHWFFVGDMITLWCGFSRTRGDCLYNAYLSFWNFLYFTNYIVNIVYVEGFCVQKMHSYKEFLKYAEQALDIIFLVIVFHGCIHYYCNNSVMDFHYSARIPKGISCLGM